MNTHCKTMLRLIAGCLPLIMLVGIPSVSVGQFETTQYEGLLDTQTGLVWGKDMGINDHALFPEMYVAEFYYAVNEAADPPRPLHPEYSGGFDDWRPPTVGEVLVAIENGLLAHMDFTYGDGVVVLAGDLLDNGTTYGDLIYWSACVEKARGQTLRYKFRFSPEPDSYWRGSGAGWVIAVRGAPADHSNCPGRHYKAPKPDKPGKPKK